MSKPICYGMSFVQSSILMQIHESLSGENNQPMRLVDRINQLANETFLNRLDLSLLEKAKERLTPRVSEVAKIALSKVQNAIDRRGQLVVALARLKEFDECSSKVGVFLKGEKDQAGCDEISTLLKSLYLSPEPESEVSYPDMQELFQQGFRALSLRQRVEFLSAILNKNISSDVSPYIAKSVLLDISQEKWKERVDLLSATDCFDFLIDLPNEIKAIEHHSYGKLEFVAKRVKRLFDEGVITDYLLVDDLESVPPQRLIDVFESIYLLGDASLHRNLDALGQTYAFHIDKTVRSLFTGFRAPKAIFDYLGGTELALVLTHELNQWINSPIEIYERRHAASALICDWLKRGGKLNLTGFGLVTLPPIFDLVAHFYPSCIDEIILVGNRLELLPIGMTHLPFTKFVLHSRMPTYDENPLRGDLSRLRSVYEYQKKRGNADNAVFSALKPLLEQNLIKII